MHTNIYLKREDLCHTGAHKINNTSGKYLLAKAWAKKESLLKQVLVSMEWLPLPCVHERVLNALCIWAKKILSGRRRM